MSAQIPGSHRLMGRALRLVSGAIEDGSAAGANPVGSARELLEYVQRALVLLGLEGFSVWRHGRFVNVLAPGARRRGRGRTASTGGASA